MRVDSLDLNLILALEAIVRLRSVSAAAQELRLTQPAVSRALARLRGHFGDALVVPIGRQMSPTEFGAELFTVATDLLRGAQAFAQQRPGFDPRSAVREFTIAASDYVVGAFLIRAVRRLAVAAPGVTVRIVSVDLLDDATFDRGAIDFAILPDLALSASHPTAELFQDTFVCAIWSENPLVGDQLTLDAFLALRHVTTAFGPNARDSHFERFLHSRQIAISTALAVPNFTQLPEFVIGTPFVATIHARLAARLPKDLPLRFLPPPLEIPPLIEFLQWHRARRHDAAALWFRRFLQEVAAQEL